ncbi:MAG: RNA-binding S4 domain-containing protein [Clostridia bacterium]|nr:RNA-binding S4 domain-containing protein [Clostridia bacterium]
MRIDKFLKVSRILKRRTLAQEACEGGKVKVNGKSVKPSFNVKVGDIVELGFNSGALRFIVKELKETVRKEEAENLYEILFDEVN